MGAARLRIAQLKKNIDGGERAAVTSFARTQAFLKQGRKKAIGRSPLAEKSERYFAIGDIASR